MPRRAPGLHNTRDCVLNTSPQQPSPRLVVGESDDLAEYLILHSLKLSLLFFNLQLAQPGSAGPAGSQQGAANVQNKADTPSSDSPATRSSVFSAAGSAAGTNAAGQGSDAQPEALLQPALQGQPCLVGALAAALPHCVAQAAAPQLRVRLSTLTRSNK